MCVYMCICVHVHALSKEGVTSPITLLCCLSSLQPMKQELMQNQFLVLLNLFLLRTACPSSLLHFFPGDFSTQDV